MGKWRIAAVVVVAGTLGLLAGLAALRWLPPWGRLRPAQGVAQAPRPQPPQQPTNPAAKPAEDDLPAGATASSVRAGGLAQGLTPPRFTDITESTGVRFIHTNGRTAQCQYLEIMGAGVALFDYDGDGNMDIFLVNGNYIIQERSPQIASKLFRNNGDGTFTDVTQQAGVGNTGYGQGCCTGDYDNDGFEDLLVTNFGPSVLFHNNGDGTFTDVTAKAGVQHSLWGQSCAFLDYDGDGWLDLYIQNYLTWAPDLHPQTNAPGANDTSTLDYESPRTYQGAPSYLYHNNHDGTFTDVTEKAGVYQPGGKGMGLACADFDEDGDIDIFQTNDQMGNYYFQNQGNGTFKEVAPLLGVGYSAAGEKKSFMGADVGDYDGDNLLDIVVPVLRREVFTLYRNCGTYFTDATMQAGMYQATAHRTGFSPNFIDYDNSGRLGLFVACGGVVANEGVPPDVAYEQRYGQPALLLANDGHGRFVNVSDLAGPYFQRCLIGRGSACGDINNDGRLDLVINNLDGPAIVLRNDTPSGHWVTLRLLGLKGSATVIGAKVHLTAGGKTQYAITRSEGGYLSVNDRRVHFGLGSATRVDSVEIVWPGGTKQVLHDVPIDVITTIRQPSTQADGI